MNPQLVPRVIADFLRDPLESSPLSLAGLAWLLAALSAAGPALAQGATPGRGQLLYETHCVACHDTQKHWRDDRIVRDWAGLVEQVRRWQGRASLNWPEADVLAVASHLNDRIYRLPRPERRAALGR